MKDFLDVPTYNLILVDSMNLAWRYYSGMRQFSWHGKQTGMLFGMARFIFKMQKLYPQAHIVFLWEGSKSRRKSLQASYKGSRIRKDSVFTGCLQEVREFIKDCGIESIYHFGLEADDLAGYLCSTAEPGERILLVSNDVDWFQFMKPNQIDIQQQGKIATFADIELSIGIPPDKMGMWKILTGDKSDDIKGIPRIPHALAQFLVNACETYEGFKSYPLKKHNKSWAIWGAKIRKNWETVIERNAELILYQPSWIEPTQIVVERGEPNREAVIKTLRANGIKSLMKEVANVRFR